MLACFALINRGQLIGIMWINLKIYQPQRLKTAWIDNRHIVSDAKGRANQIGASAPADIGPLTRAAGE